MPVDYKPSPNKGLMGSPLAKGVMAYFTGGASLLAEKNPALGQAVGMMGGGSSPEAGLTPSNPVVDTTQEPVDSAINRRVKSLSQDPQMTLMAGIKALDDPSVPDYLKQSAAEPLLRAKHYGGRRIS